MSAGITLTLRTGYYGDQAQELALPIDERLLRELMEPFELSDEPFSLLLASPALFGGVGDAITIRRKRFAFRAATAKDVAQLVERALLEMFGERDETDGYRKTQGSQQGAGNPGC